jgi:hypothetical protein
MYCPQAQSQFPQPHLQVLKSLLPHFGQHKLDSFIGCPVPFFLLFCVSEKLSDCRFCFIRLT